MSVRNRRRVEFGLKNEKKKKSDISMHKSFLDSYIFMADANDNRRF